MIPFRKPLLHAGVKIEKVIRRGCEGLGRLFLSKAEVARRAAGKFELLKRQELEIERLDRLRNPRDYEGK